MEIEALTYGLLVLIIRSYHHNKDAKGPFLFPHFPVTSPSQKNHVMCYVIDHDVLYRIEQKCFPENRDLVLED